MRNTNVFAMDCLCFSYIHTEHTNAFGFEIGVGIVCYLSHFREIGFTHCVGRTLSF